MVLGGGAGALDELTRFEGVGASAPSSNASLLRVVLHNLFRALDQGHVSRGAVKGVLDTWLALVRDRSAGDPETMHVDEAYNLLFVALSRAQREWMFSRSHELDSFSEERAVSFQPSWAFHWWFPDDIEPAARRPDPQESDLKILVEYYGQIPVDDLIAAFRLNQHRANDKSVGQSGGVVFFTPEVGEIEELCATAAGIHQAPHRLGELTLEDHAIADRMRNLLGLRSRNNSEYGVIIRLKGGIGQLQQAAAPLRPPAGGVAGRRPMAAPTQFDAVGHDRFRHWPQNHNAPAIDFGRTWDLDDNQNFRPDCGAAEFVIAPLPVFQIESIIPAGPIRTPSETREQRRRADERFADAICHSQSILDLVASFEARLFH